MTNRRTFKRQGVLFLSSCSVSPIFNRTQRTQLGLTAADNRILILPCMAVTTSDKPHTRKIELSDLRDSVRASSPPCSVPHPKPGLNPPASHEISTVKTSDLNRHSTNAVFRTESYNNHEPSVFRNQTEFGFLWLLAPDSADTVLHSQDFSHLGLISCIALPRWRNWQTRMIQVHVSVMDVEVRLLSGA